jgi:hypothetical protein
MSPGDEAYKAWLKTLKVGSDVALYYGHGSARKESITRETEASFFVGSARYRKSDGHSVGSFGSGGYLHPFTSEVRDEIHKRKLTHALAGAMPHALWHLDLDQLRELALIVGTVSKECAEVANEALKS